MFYNFVDNEQFNYQINRCVASGGTNVDIEEIKEICPRLKDFKSWSSEWLKLADKAKEEKRYFKAFSYYRMAEFYMLEDNEEKADCYRKFMECFFNLHENEDLQRIEIPFEGGVIPAYKIECDVKKGTLVVCGGFDSLMEEFYPVLKLLSNQGYEIIAYEGPGQGGARRSKNKLFLRYDWEVPTSRVLDYFDLNNVTLLGFSLGGYLAPRAAAYDKRIKNVICYDIFYKGFDMIFNRMSESEVEGFKELLVKNDEDAINKEFYRKMRESIDLAWKIKQGMYVTGTKTPYDFIKEFEKYDMESILDKITANVLLLAGENDQYVPIKRLVEIENGMKNAKNIVSRKFTKEENADQHCQTGNLKLLMQVIVQFLYRYCK